MAELPKNDESSAGSAFFCGGGRNLFMEKQPLLVLPALQPLSKERSNRRSDLFEYNQGA
jgi:hypothetical protein